MQSRLGRIVLAWPGSSAQPRRTRRCLEFKARGIGSLLIPLVVRRQARKQLPRNEQKLKELLELRILDGSVSTETQTAAEQSKKKGRSLPASR